MDTYNAYDIYNDIRTRTGGDIYLGVVGPVRTGKSTFIRKFANLMILPYVEDFHTAERIRDELPQSGTGRTIMTTEPKFVPAQAAEIRLGSNTSCRVRLDRLCRVYGRRSRRFPRSRKQLGNAHDLYAVERGTGTV